MTVSCQLFIIIIVIIIIIIIIVIIVAAIRIAIRIVAASGMPLQPPMDLVCMISDAAIALSGKAISPKCIDLPKWCGSVYPSQFTTSYKPYCIVMSCQQPACLSRIIVQMIYH